MKRRLFVLGCVLLLVTGGGLLYPLTMREWDTWVYVRWGAPQCLLLLGFLPFALIRSTVGMDRRLPYLGLPLLAPLVQGPRGVRTYLRDLPGVCRTVALGFALVALAQPQNLLQGMEREDHGVDVMLALDLSGSMRALMDKEDPRTHAAKEPPLTRLEMAKKVLLDFVQRRTSDRIGLVVFAKSTYLLSPLTLDSSLLAQLVQKMGFHLIQGDGTAIGDALGVSVARLRNSKAKTKAVVLLTDGVSNQGMLTPEHAAHVAKELGVRIYTVQIGDGEAWVPSGNDLFGETQYTHVSDTVNPTLLQAVARDSGGQAFVAANRHALVRSMHVILDQLEKTRFVSASSSLEELFPLFLLPAVGLMVMELWIRLMVLRRFP